MNMLAERRQLLGCESWRTAREQVPVSDAVSDEGEQKLPPPSKFRKNRLNEHVPDLAKIRRTVLYITKTRREAAEQEFMSSRAEIPALNIDDWRPVFETSMSFRER
jgi:hypothetical protein